VTETCRRHEWTATERGWRCTECGAESATCGTCGEPSGTNLLLCERCKARADRVLDDIAKALRYYERDPRSPVASPGDMRLVAIRSNRGRGGIETPGQIEDALWAWVARWTEYVGAQRSDAYDALKSMHQWAAHNVEASGWHEYGRDALRLRHHARRIAGLLPKRLPEPCVHCGGRAVRDWATREWEPRRDGVSDTVRCTSCHRTWDDPRAFAFTTRQHIFDLPNVRPDALVTLEQARTIFPDVPAATLRGWVFRDRQAWDQSVEQAQVWWGARCAWEAGGATWEAWAEYGWTEPGDPPPFAEMMMPEHGRERGVPLYRVGDIYELVMRRVDQSRSGRRVAAPAASE